MRSVVALLIVVGLGSGIAACGGSREDPASEPSSATNSGASAGSTVPTVAQERVRRIRGYGHEASAADLQAVTSLLKRYYAAAAEGNGAAACTMIVPSLAAAVPEDYARRPELPYLLGDKTCRAVMTKVFERRHAELVAAHESLDVYMLRLSRIGGYAIMRFRTMPEREISVGREKGRWWLNVILDSELA